MRSKLLLKVLMLFTFSCSKGGDGSLRPPGPEVREVDNLETEMSGIYMAEFAPMNTVVSGRINGSLTILKEKDQFIANVRLAGTHASTPHTQSIHLGTRCPDVKDDTNADGFIDGEEGARVFKEILIPLDDDLSSQWLGLGTFPMTDQYGNYFWSRMTPYEKLMADLNEEDINPADDFAKLLGRKDLNPLSKVVVITSIPESIPLPGSVSGRGRMGRHQALPIACGIIRRIDKVPGIIDTDVTEIPVPEGGSFGGTGGIDDGADFSNTTSGSGNYEDEEDSTIDTSDNSPEYDSNNNS